MTRDAALNELERALTSDFLKALSEPTRVRLLRSLIAEGPQDVGALARPLPQERSVISRHIGVLERAGLVRLERQGRRRVVHIVPSAFIGTLEDILATTKRCVAVCCPADA